MSKSKYQAPLSLIPVLTIALALFQSPTSISMAGDSPLGNDTAAFVHAASLSYPLPNPVFVPKPGEEPLFEPAETQKIAFYESLGDEITTQILPSFADLDFAFSLVDLETGATIAEHNQHEQFTAASTYKLFTTYEMLHDIEHGALNITSDIGGYQAIECIRVTIEYSENDCIEFWISSTGNEKSTAAAARSGASETVFASFDIKTSAHDLVAYLFNLNSGNLLNEQNTEILLEYMREQIHREGIPAGIPAGAKVANKPGWLEDVRNDAAIIEYENHNLALAILTTTNSFELISQITADIFALFNDS